MRLPQLILALLCCAVAAPARAAPVRALEHPEFSRLLLPVPPAVDWTLRRDRRSIRLVLRGPVPALALDGIFDRMPRSRIRSVAATETADGSTLTLELGCDCELVVERLGESLLAVDVRSPDSAAPLAVRDRDMAGITPDAPRQTAEAAAPDAGGHAAAAARAPGQAADFTASDSGRERPAGAKFLSIEPGSAPRADGPEPASPAAADPVRLARDALIRQLERAAEAGLVELAPSAVETARTRTASRPGPAAIDQRLPEPALLPRLVPDRSSEDQVILNPVPSEAAPRPATSPEPAATATSPVPAPSEPAASADPDPADPEAAARSLLAHLVAREPVAEVPAPGPGEACVADATLDVRRWPQADGDLIGALGGMRRALYDDSGDIAPDAVRDLARLYISVGFGREAAALLEAAGLAQGADPLHDLSMLVEGRPAAAHGPILRAEGCSGRVLMWRAVAGAEPLDSAAPAWNTIRSALMELPPRLRRLVGQELARQALLGDRPAAARQVIDLLDRTPGTEPELETRVRAALAVSRGEVQYALTLISPEIEGRASPDPEALLLHARATLAADSTPDPAVMSMLDTAIPGYDIAAPVGRALVLVRARLEAAAGRPAAALEMVQQVVAAGGGANADATETGHRILGDLPAELRSGPVGARLILAHRNLLDKGAESRGLRLAYADALIEGGLPNAALTLLATPRVLQDRETRLVAAKAHQLLGQDDEVFRLLDGLKGPAEARLRAAVYRRAGDMAAAHAELAALEPTDADRNATALLAGEWDGLNADMIAAPYALIAAYAEEEARSDASAGLDTAGKGIAIPRLPTLNAAQAALAEARRLREAFGVAGPEG